MKPQRVADDVEVALVEGHCEEHGDYQVERPVVMGRPWGASCPECDQRRQEAVAQQKREGLERAKADRLAELLSQANIPKRFEGFTFDDYEPVNDKAAKIKQACQRYADRFEDRLQMGGGLVLCGITGTGKTHLACAIANHVMKEHRRVALFTSVVKMSRAIKASYGSKSDRTEEQVIRSFTDPDLLIVDEIGAQRGTETELLLAQEIIDERYQQVRPTILISNLSESRLAEYIGERAVDRMYEGGGAILAFEWESYRRSGKGRRFPQPGPQLVPNGMRDFYAG
ncbi:MAG: ATP-binding protein [Sphingopyxis sp.]|nr:MAG: ATP-binding protein [Sphingopyxis sp.]|tara:strand:+ start:5732 stop:6583 length:852 start_codon:yes stop_codon:yes gene_type:complete